MTPTQSGQNNAPPLLGFIGGTGLYQLAGLKIEKELNVDTPFGAPSAQVRIGRMGERQVAFLPRHGDHHQFLPSEINYRANIWALKSVGVREIVSVSATGSLVKEIEPGTLVVPSQYFDWTKGKRVSTFFGEGITAHISTARPSCGRLSRALSEAAKKVGEPLPTDRTYACVEGPRLGTRAESFFLKQSGCDVVGMTNVPEAFLAREAQVCYVTLAIATDYDCWLDDPSQHVTLEAVFALYKKKLGQVQSIISTLCTRIDLGTGCECRQALNGAVMTPIEKLSGRPREILAGLQG